MFSRTAVRLRGETNRLYQLRDELAGQGHSIVDFISGNVNEHGIRYPQTLLEQALAGAARAAQVYRPDPLGKPAARQAISDYYDGHGVAISPANILLTPGTSISYWYCFKLLADEGDEILCPQPTYPLFDYLAALGGVRLVNYPLAEGENWAIDLEALENSISNSTRAIVLISPHNPTGHVAAPDEVAALAEIARRHELAIIADEVFSEFLLTEGRLPRPAGSDAPIIFTLNGFSKMYALPGIKFGWIAASGDPELVRQAMGSLEFVSDTFLPVSELTQEAAPEIMRSGKDFLRAYRSEIRSRWDTARLFLEGMPACRFVPPGGGFYVTVELRGICEQRAAEAILNQNHILVHPGYFYDMQPDHLVFSFVHHPDSLSEHLPKMAATLGGLHSGSAGK